VPHLTPFQKTSTSLPPHLLRVRGCDMVLEGAVPLRARRLLSVIFKKELTTVPTLLLLQLLSTEHI
jgi:hypothetical protein